MGSGLLVVLEGPEGAGKSTQVARLAAHLRKTDTPHAVLREPGGTRLGEQIRQLLLDPASEMVAEAECLLFLASRSELVTRVLRPALDTGKVIILDRFFLSTYAYQIGGRSLPAAEVKAANALATGGLIPGITLLLNIAPEAGLARTSRRGAHDRMELTGPEFHARVASAFALFATAAWQESHPECGEIVAVDGSLSEDGVFDSIMRELTGRWPEMFR